MTSRWKSFRCAPPRSKWKTRCFLVLYLCLVGALAVIWGALPDLELEGLKPGNSVEDSRRVFVLPAGDVKARVSDDLDVLSAYFDDRRPDPVIRLFAVTEIRDPTLHCCLRSSRTKSWLCSVTTVVARVLAASRGNATEVMLTCSGFPERDMRDHPDKCMLLDPTRGQYTKSSVVAEVDIAYGTTTADDDDTDTFTVCVVPRRAPPDPQDIPEFVEIVKLLGARHVFSYHENRTLNEAFRTSSISNINGRISWDAVHLRPSSGRPVTSYPTLATNDCLYRTVLHKHSYVAFLDVDEILVPTSTKTWSDLVASLKSVHNSTAVGSYTFQTFAFYDETTNRTASYAGSKIPIRNLPRTVRFRSRDKTPLSNVLSLVEVAKVESVRASGIARMLPGFSVINVPLEFGFVHRFIPRRHSRLKDLTVDPSKDFLVPGLFRALQAH